MSHFECVKCNRIISFERVDECSHCKRPDLFNSDMDFSFCPICESKHLYKKKDFNQALGCIIILIGALFVPWTYGLSLIFLSALDYFLYRRIKDSVECYKCKTEFKNINVPTSLEPFDHHIAELYEKHNI
ncbi:MAG: hypothetical protein HOG33_04630 [Candidatus Marinimicrobia bacterium]|nr:hypothetical protein [Candidatus Neomarinimicrobiota bacterium]MBT4317526.1 hypothetical protein [Candidatus Neomarinimicrobiota bacterium]MBT4783946.1 hypothetical protein [Candidatus Neomarinimicrobiota bacterium]